MNSRRQFLAALGLGALAAPLASLSQPAQKVRRIGLLSPGNPRPASAPGFWDESLRRAGYAEGRNLVFERRFAEWEVERLFGLAEDLVRLDVELIIAAGNHASDAAKRSTQTIPIVMWANMFPVERGLVASLARPGGNVTGTVWWANPLESYLKLYQILKDAVPNAKRAALITDPSDPQVRFYDSQERERRLAGIGMTLVRVEMTRTKDLEAALNQLKASRAEVLHVGGTTVVLSSFREIAAFAVERKLVSIADNPGYLGAGGLLNYGPEVADLRDRTVSFVDRILRGAKPGDLPVEQASKIEMALNSRTARAIGFKPPPSFMQRVDRVVE